MFLTLKNIRKYIFSDIYFIITVPGAFMSRNFLLLIRNLRLMKEQNSKLVEELIILNQGLDVEIAKRFINEEISKLNSIEVIPPYSGRTMQLIIDRANKSLSNFLDVRE